MALTIPMLTAWTGPRGKSFAAYLTPDKTTGLSEWGKKTFININYKMKI